MKKLINYVVVAILAFFVGIVSASALNKITAQNVPMTAIDTMGNVVSH